MDQSVYVLGRSNLQGILVFLYRITAPFEAEFNRKFQLVQVEDATGKQEEFRNTLANGLVLFGYLKVV